VNQQGGKYGSPLRAALAWKHVAIADLLLEAGATPIDETVVPSPVAEWDLELEDEDESSTYDTDDESSNPDEDSS
jgi:hypothetical protein